MLRRRLLLLLALPWPAAVLAEEPPRYSTEALRRLAEDQARRRADWWERQRQRREAERVDRELERRRDATGRQIERWEEGRQQRLWGRTVP